MIFYPPIPEGWRELGPDEVISEDDKCALGTQYEGDEDVWGPTFNSIGHTPRAYKPRMGEMRWIREGQPEPAKPPSDWLNPWD